MTPAWPLLLLALAQVVAGARVVGRLLRTASGRQIAASDAPAPGERVSVVVPVLNERERLGPCLAGLVAQPAEVREILVVDGGSTDGTPALVAAYARRDARLRLIDAGPAPHGWNGKARNLQYGLDRADPAASWLLTVDADVRVRSALTRSLLAHARRGEAAALGVATRQRLSGSAEGLVHPALLTTLVYRFGIPGQTTRRVAAVQANGQCSLYRREALVRIGGFGTARASRCEDVTVARALANAGDAVGFYEADDLAEVAMYVDWRDAWRNWPRSLPLRDCYSGWQGWLGLAEVALTQAAPLPLAILLRRAPGPARSLAAVNGVLLLVRLGVLAGTARAYLGRPWSYWLSPLLDLPVAVQLWRSALRRDHVWRGRPLVQAGARKDA